MIIPTKNSGETIETCLKSVKEQTYPNIEVIVVDNYSTDKTREIAEKYGARVVMCRAIRSRARNVGGGLARGEFILSVDSDMELTPNVVSECVAKRWVKWGHEVTLFCGKYRGCKEHDELDGVEIIRKGNPYTVYLCAAEDYLCSLRKRNYDVIIDDINGVPFFTPLYAKKLKVAIMHHLVKDIFFKRGYLGIRRFWAMQPKKQYS